jgi:hypothetical protein
MIEKPISKKEIAEAMTPNGGWTRKTLAGWGIDWPPPRGWRKKLEDRGRIHVPTANRLLEKLERERK